MALQTTSTIAVARQALHSALDAGDLAGKAFYAWPGPHADQLQNEAAWIERVVSWRQELPNIKAGRRQRQETYTFEVAIISAKPETDALGAKQSFDRLIELCTVVENALADDVTLGQTVIQWMTAEDRRIEELNVDSGWAHVAFLEVTGNARLR